MRYGFSDIFRQNPDKSVTVLRRVKIGRSPVRAGAVFWRGVRIGGIDVFQHFGQDLDAHEVDGWLEIKAFDATPRASPTRVGLIWWLMVIAEIATALTVGLEAVTR